MAPERFAPSRSGKAAPARNALPAPRRAGIRYRCSGGARLRGRVSGAPAAQGASGLPVADLRYVFPRPAGVPGNTRGPAAGCEIVADGAHHLRVRVVELLAQALQAPVPVVGLVCVHDYIMTQLKA